MKSNTKSSITLPADEVRIVENLRRQLRARSKVEVIRRALRLLQETTDRSALRRAFREASAACRPSTLKELDELDALTSEGLGE